jgi:hypothetical protein
MEGEELKEVVEVILEEVGGGENVPTDIEKKGMYVCRYVCVNICIYVYIYVYIYIFIHVDEFLHLYLSICIGVSEV